MQVISGANLAPRFCSMELHEMWDRLYIYAWQRVSSAELYRSFLAVLTEGSLSGAARVLDIAQPTVGRHVAALERALGMPLFTRSQTGLLPLEAALSLRPYAEAMSSAAAALERAAASQGSGVRGAVRITASEVIGVEVLPLIIARLRAEHPDLQVELVLSNRMQDLLQREASPCA
jgi:DNA-binding transcriptional LysR family regulator